MQVIITKDYHSHVIQDIDDLIPLVDEYMGREAYLMFRNFLEKVEDVVGVIREHIISVNKINESIDSVALDNEMADLESYFVDEFKMEATANGSV